MRVIAGDARGTKLQTLEGEDITRPTTDKVKEAIFSSLQFILPGAQVLDLYGGSGQLGIEALSRGAARCTFIDKNRQAASIIIANCKAAKVFEKSRVSINEAERFLLSTKEKYDIVLLDPPYRMGTLLKILPLVEQVTMPGGTVVCESEIGLELPEVLGELELTKQHKYGKILVTRYTKRQQQL